jgi:DNA-directed RNA polymerase subunit RPC12/RpoP
MCFCVVHVYKKVYYILILAIPLEERKNMRKSYAETGTDEENDISNNAEAGFTCDTCGEEYHKPLLATVHSSEGSQRYYACPRCMVKVAELRTEETEEKREKRTPINDSETLRTAPKGSSDCGHFLGYLAKRPRDASIPDECLTCDKMIDCLTG